MRNVITEELTYRLKECYEEYRRDNPHDYSDQIWTELALKSLAYVIEVKQMIGGC